MIITLGGTPGSGKSTVGNILVEKLGYKKYSSGDKFRDMAEERGMSIIEFGKVAEKDQKIDDEIDLWQKKLGETEDNFIIDGHMSFHFIPHSFKVFIDADIETRARRIFNDKIRKETNITFEKSLSNVRKREESEKIRYKQYYGKDPYEHKHYDLVVDSTHKTPEEIVEIIVNEIKKKLN